MRLYRRVRSLWPSTPQSTTGSTKPFNYARNWEGDGLSFRASRIEEDMERALWRKAIEREREQRALDLLWRSGTWPKVLG